MTEQAPTGYSTVWPTYDPDREDIAAAMGHRLLLAAAIVIAILSIWGSATIPRSPGLGHDITTAIPDSGVGDSAPGGALPANHTPGNLP